VIRPAEAIELQPKEATMDRIKILDLPTDDQLSDDDLESVAGGVTLSSDTLTLNFSAFSSARGFTDPTC
jgi:hypothetical protein